MTVRAVEVLLHYHVHGAHHPLPDTAPIRKAREAFLAMDVLRPAKTPGELETTPLGAAWVKAICDTPKPNLKPGAPRAVVLQELTLPCQSACRKCGSGDASLRYMAKGDRWEHHERKVDAATPVRRELVVDHRTFMDATHECIVHTCRVCGWRWETLPLDSQ